MSWPQGCAGCFSRGLYLTFFAGSVLRLAPPLILGLEEADTALQTLGAALEDAVAGRVSDGAVAAITGW